MAATVGELTDRNAVLAAIEEFDQLGRDAFLAKYGFGPSTRYTLRRDGRNYDVKAIVGAAYGHQYPDRAPLSSADFSSGLGTTVPKLKSLGFEIVEPEELSIRDALLAVLKSYDAAEKRGGPELDGLVEALEQTEVVLDRELLKVTRSTGAGNWPNVPWVAIPDQRETSSIQRGVYPVYLFRADLSGVYLTLNQGVTDLINDRGFAGAMEAVKDKTSALRQQLAILDNTRLQTDGSIDLRSPGAQLAKGYETGTIAHRFYSAADVPDDEELKKDLTETLDAYDEYLNTAATSFLFQANPRYFDIARAVRELNEMNWTVAQSKNQIKAGQRVYIWQAGPGGGVIALGTILTDPQMMPDQEGQQYIVDQKKFDGAQLRVRLSIDRVLDPPVLRDQLKEHPVLKTLGVINFANATNYNVTPEQDAALRAMIDEPTPPDTTPESLEQLVERWKNEVGYPRPRDEKAKAERAELAEALSEGHLDSVSSDPASFSSLEFSRFAGPAAGRPGSMSVVHKYLNSGNEAKLQVAQALRHLLYDDGDVVDRINDLLLVDEWSAPGLKESLITKALWVAFPQEWLPVFPTEGENGKLALMKAPELGISLREDLDELSPGERIRWANDALRSKMEPLLPDDLRGQSEFLYWLRDQHLVDGAEPESLADVADQLLLDPDWLTEVVELLEEKGQVIFQGPPGTGKTYVAREIGRHFERLGGGCEIVQFHPSYSYEDFVEGYRPRVVAGQPGFELVSGPLVRLAKRAEAEKDKKFVLVIDELNRGNVAKVFGELYFLLEYRGDRIRLQYGEDGASGSDEDGRFGLPKNLWIVATMNTADRSIALMDGALRRRFYFIDYFPDEPPIAGLLKRWLSTNDLQSLEWISDVLEEANRRLDIRDAAIGPSHFMREDLTEPHLERIWKHAVIPYLQERLIGEPERLKEFELSALKQALSASSAPSDEAPREVPQSDVQG